jgi:hypothetical protein
MSVTRIGNSDALPGDQIAMSDPIDFALAARRLRRSVGMSLVSTNSIENVERVLDQATALQIEAKANIRNVILVLEESATKLRRITSMPNHPIAASIAFDDQLAQIEQLLRIAHDKAAAL